MPTPPLPSTHPYGDVTMALSFGGHDREDIGRRHFLQAADAVGLNERAIARVLDDLVGRIAPRVDTLDGLPFDSRRIHKLRKAMLWRLGRLGA